MFVTSYMIWAVVFSFIEFSTMHHYDDLLLYRVNSHFDHSIYLYHRTMFSHWVPLGCKNIVIFDDRRLGVEKRPCESCECINMCV